MLSKREKDSKFPREAEARKGFDRESRQRPRSLVAG